MDIHAEKLELIQLLLNTDSEVVLKKLKRLLVKSTFKPNAEHSPSTKDIDAFYDEIKLDFSGFKFNRDEANER